MLKVSEDISRKTILVLVVLTVLVSALGTMTVLDSVERAQEPVFMETPGSSNSVQGKVTLTIAQPAPPVTGKVILELLPSK